MWDLGGRGTEGLTKTHGEAQAQCLTRALKTHVWVKVLRDKEPGVVLCDPYTCGPDWFSLANSLVCGPPVEFPGPLSTGKAPHRNVSLRPLPAASPKVGC